MNANILITGDSGYIGSALIEYLNQQPFVNKVIGYDIINGNDILHLSSLVTILTSNNINVVIHLAALSSVSACNDNPSQAFKINGDGTNNVLNAMKEAGCKHIIYASTSSIYGNNSDLPYTEDMLPAPCSSYGSSKLLGEEAIYNHYSTQPTDSNYLIFRMFNVVGTSGFESIDSKSNAGYDRLFAALESGHITIYGNDYDTNDKTCERDYVSLKDVCHAYLLGINCVLSRNNIRETINICTCNPISVNQIITTWNTLSKSIQNNNINTLNHHLLPHVKYNYGPRRLGDPSKVYGSNTKAEKILQWTPQRKIEDIILDLAMDKKLTHV